MVLCKKIAEIKKYEAMNLKTKKGSPPEYVIAAN